MVDEGQSGGDTHKEPGFKSRIPTLLTNRVPAQPGAELCCAVSISSGDQVDIEGGLGQTHSSASWHCPLLVLPELTWAKARRALHSCLLVLALDHLVVLSVLEVGS